MVQCYRNMLHITVILYSNFWHLVTLLQTALVTCHSYVMVLRYSVTLRPVHTIERVLWYSRHDSHEHDVREFEKKCLCHKLPPRLGRTSILRQGMLLCSSWKPTTFGSFRSNTALSRNIFIACSQHVCWLSTLANIMFLVAASGCVAEYVP